MSEGDFPAPDGWEVAEGDERPGAVLHPGENTIVNRGNNPLQEGETIAVWVKRYADGHGTAVCRADLQIIGDDGEGDIFAIPAAEDPLEASRVYRISSDLRSLRPGHVYSVPEYDQKGGVLTVSREVKTHCSETYDIHEARSLGGQQDWALVPSTEL